MPLFNFVKNLKYKIMRTIAKLFIFLSFVLLASSCNKDEQLIEEQAKPIDNVATINRMVAITIEQTKALKDEIAALDDKDTKMSTEQYNSFVRGTIETYVGKLIESDPERLQNDNLQINKVDANESEWSNNQNVYGGNVETILPPHIIARLDKLTLRLDAIIDNPFYEMEININAGATEIENVLQGEITDINNDLTLNPEEKDILTVACMTAKAMVMPQLGFFKTLATGADLLGEDMENFRRRGFWGKLIRAVARVAIAIVAVAVVAVLIIKLAPIIAVGSKFALKIGTKGILKKALFGVSKKGISSAGVMIKGGLYMPSSLLLGGSGGIIKAADKWDTDLSLKYWYKEFDFKGKVGA